MKKTALILLLTLFINGCYESPLQDRNSSEESPGNDMWGNPVTDLSMSADGRFAVRGTVGKNSDRGKILLNVVDMNNESNQTFKIEGSSKKLVFGRGSTIYIIQSYHDDESRDNCMVRDFNLESGEYGKSWTGAGCVGVSIDRTETIVATWNKDEVLIVNTVTDTKKSFSYPNRIYDVRWSPIANELIVITSFKMHFINPVKGTVDELGDIDEGFLKISSDGKYAAVSPSVSGVEIIKIFDLKEHRWTTSLNGSRKVEFVPDSSLILNTAKGTELDDNIEDPSVNNLVVTDIDNNTVTAFGLGMDSVEWYIVPNAETVLAIRRKALEGDFYGSVINIKSGEIQDVESLDSLLTEFSVMSKGRVIFFIKDSTLYRLDLSEGQLKEVELRCGLYYGSPEFCKADEIMFSKDEDNLLLGMINGEDIAVMNIESLSIEKFYRTESSDNE